MDRRLLTWRAFERPSPRTSRGGPDASGAWRPAYRRAITRLCGAGPSGLCSVAVKPASRHIRSSSA